MSDMLKDLQVDLVLPGLKASSYKTVLQAIIREIAGRSGVPSVKLYDRLLDKEKEASSAIGGGVAVPNLQLPGLKHPYAVLATLRSQADFNAPDNKPVDLVYLLLSPQSDGPLHLRRLARVSRLLKSHTLREKILEAPDDQTIRALLMAPEGWTLAA